MTTIAEWLARCEDDTRLLLGNPEANRLAAWRNYTTEAEQVAFICRLIQKRGANGFLIHRKGGVSLESIAATHRPDLFDARTLSIARQVLQI